MHVSQLVLYGTSAGSVPALIFAHYTHPETGEKYADLHVFNRSGRQELLERVPYNEEERRGFWRHAEPDRPDRLS